MSTNIPWRIASQRYTVLNAEKEPIVTLEFIHNHDDADHALLRIVPFDTTKDAHAIMFATGGYVESAAIVPRNADGAVDTDPENASGVLAD